MSKEKETEKIINEKLDSREFAFDEKAWADMENLLDAQEKRKKRAFFWYFSASMLVILVAGGAYYYSQKADTGNVTLSVEQKSVVHSPQPIANRQKLITDNKQLKANSQKEEGKNEIKAVETPQNEAKKSAPAATKKITTQTLKTSTASSKISNTKAVAQNQIFETATTTNENLAVTTLSQNEEIKQSEASFETSDFKNEILTTTEKETVSVQKETEKEEEKVLAVDSAKAEEQTPESENKNPLTAPGKETKNAWGIMAGVGGWAGYNEAGKNGLGFTGGIYYQRALSKRFDLGLSILYTSRGGLNTHKSFVNSNYGFGIESDVTIVSAQTLHYLSLPLTIRFNISPRSHIYIGAAYYQLFATTSKITNQTENSFGVVESNTEKQTGEHKAFRNNDLVAFLGYDLTLFSRMSVGLQINYGFFDNVNNSYYTMYGYTPKQFDRNMGLQLQLKYDLIRH